MANPTISTLLEKNIKFLENLFSPSSDLQIRTFHTRHGKGALVFFESLVTKKTVSDQVLAPLLLHLPKLEMINYESLLTIHALEKYDSWQEAIPAILNGSCLLLLQNQRSCYGLEVKGYPDRQVTEPESETVVRGPREGFVENLLTNISLIRRRLNTVDLKVELMEIGDLAPTKVAVIYLTSTTRTDLVLEVKKRLQAIKLPTVLESGYLEEFIEDNKYSVFPQIAHTERPDRVVANLLEGRVAILCDGTPFVLIIPTTFNQLWQANEDYYERYPIASLIRSIRLASLLLSLLLPSLFVAVISFHPEMLPTVLLLNFMQQREGVPFSIFVQALIMEVSFEALREAGVRLPRAVGQAVSIVGALVIGEAAVKAGLVAPAMVIMVAVTGIASFAAGNYPLAIAMRLLRFPMLALAAILGLYGIMLGVIMIVLHVTSLHSFGQPYMSPIAPLNIQGLKDFILRVPIWFNRRQKT